MLPTLGVVEIGGPNPGEGNIGCYSWLFLFFVVLAAFEEEEEGYKHEQNGP